MTASSFVERLPVGRRGPQWLFPVLGLACGFGLVVAVHSACPPKTR